jgi:hypothetical protein
MNAIDSGIPLIDLSPWFTGDEAARDALAADIDRVLKRVGFIVLVGHGVPTDLVENVRATGHDFFALPSAAKEHYRTQVAGRGWLAIGAEANGYSEGTETPPDLKESYVVGSEAGGVIAPDAPFAEFFGENVWPTEVPEFQPLVKEYLARMRELADVLLALCARALGLPDSYFAGYTHHPSWAYQFNWYPSREQLGADPEEDQYRIGPHTDFGTLTLLDRQPGSGGLQVDIEGEGWVDAPHIPGALIVNTGDLLARWTGNRWRSNRHRVLAPPAEAPQEELMSLVYFFEADPEAVITPLAPPVGRTADLPTVRAGDFIRERYDAITMI